MKPPSSHTHCQAAKANATAKAWQRVCLPNITEKQINNKRFVKYNDGITAASQNLGILESWRFRFLCNFVFK